MSTEADFAEFRDLMIEDLRSRQRERTAGHTLAKIHDDVRSIGVRVANVEARLERVEAKTASTPPPPHARRKLESVAEINDDDPTAVRAFKSGELANVVQSVRLAALFWKVMTALALVGAAVATIYAAVRK